MIMEEIQSSETEESNAVSTEESHAGENSNNKIVMDYTDVFTTNTLFDTRIDLINWARRVARQHMMVLVVKRSDNGGGSKSGRVYLSCERGGQYRTFKGKNMRKLQVDVDDSEEINEAIKKPRKRKMETKKCGCRFLLKGKQLHVMGPWELAVDWAVHNHPIEKSLQSDSVGRLSSVEEVFDLDLSEDDIQPKKTLRSLQKKDSLNASTMKPVDNAYTEHGVVERGSQPQLQFLMEKLKKHDYYFQDRRCKDTNTVNDLFFSHPTSVKLLRAFPNVLLMYCTNKTDKNRMSLLEIVGVTSTDMMFSIACVYLKAEKEDNYIWACSTLRALMDETRLPYLIVTDTNLALMNAVHVTFPTSSHFLCRWHINKNILANCKGDLQTNEKWEEFNSYWQLLMFAEDETAFNERYLALVEHFKGYPDPVNYVFKQWIEPYKDKFVACWTNQILHYGNTTTKRAESLHAALRKQLCCSIDNFETCWDQIHTLYEASHNAIKCSFEKSTGFVYHKFKPVIFKSLRGMVSNHALQLILDEVVKGSKSKAGVDPRVCGCNLRKTCGLPCAHELTEYVREDKPIPLSAVDGFWKKLDMEESKVSVVDNEVDLENQYKECMAKLDQMFKNENESGKLLLLKRLQEVVVKEFTKG